MTDVYKAVEHRWSSPPMPRLPDGKIDRDPAALARWRTEYDEWWRNRYGDPGSTQTADWTHVADHVAGRTPAS